MGAEMGATTSIFPADAQVKKLMTAQGRGDQYVRVVVEVPKSMTKAQKDKLREFDAALSDKNYQKRKSFTERLRDCFSDK